MQIHDEAGILQLTPSQQQALDRLVPALLDRGIAALIGPTGSGKSHLMKELLRVLAAEGLTEVLTVAPTHRRWRW